MIVEILITLLIIFLVYASCSIRSNIYLKVFCKKQTEEKAQWYGGRNINDRG